MMRAKATAAYSKDRGQTRDLFYEKTKNGDNSLPTRYGYGIALSEIGEFDQARKVLDKLVKDYPDNISVRLVQADNELDAGNIDKGLAQLKVLYEEQRAKGNNMVDIYYANALVLTKRHSIAIPILQESLQCQQRRALFSYSIITRLW